MTRTQANIRLVKLAKDLQLLMLDVDGVLTDGGIILTSGGEESKRFHVQDGMGITLARACGIKIAIITSRTSEVVERRAKELNIDEVIQGVSRKTNALKSLLEKHQIQAVS